MKQIILFAAILLTGAAAFAQEPACPSISVSAPYDATPSGNPVSFTGNITGKGDFTFNWTVSGGTITSGQGTSSIMVDSKGMEANSSITATLEAGGVASSCPNSSSATAGISEAVKPPAKSKVKAKPGKRKAKP